MNEEKTRRGRPTVDNVYKHPLTISFNEQQRELLRELASKQGIGVSHLVRNCLGYAIASLDTEISRQWEETRKSSHE